MIHLKALALALLVLLYSSSYSNADVNEYGVDCSLTPWMSSCGDDWKNQEGMEEYTISDDGRVQIDLPFGFPFQGNTYTTSWMFSNGVVGFMSPTGSFCCNGIDVENGDWSNYTGLPYFSYSIAALWTDLRDYNVDVDGDGIDDTGFFTYETDTTGDGNVDTLRYLWRNISEYARSSNVNTFGTEIDSGGAIEIHHFDINIDSHAVTVGVFGDVTDGEVEQYEYYSYNQDYINDQYTIYTFDLSGACEANPLISDQCPGYAEAYALLIYNQQCASNPLYDSGCPGYDTAYYNQQCSLDATYDQGCPGYAEAYYNQQCSLDATYDSGCPGYAEAYYLQQCTLSPLYDTGCEGYETAYIEQQCETDPLYSPTCTGYAAALAELENQQTTPPIVTVEEDYSQPDIIDDPIVDNIVFDEPTVMVESYAQEVEIVTIENSAQVEEVVEVVEPEQTEESLEAEIEADLAATEEQQEEVEQTSQEEENVEVVETDTDSDSVDQDTDDQSEDKNNSSDSKKDSKKKKLREIAAKRASQLAERMSEAASLEAQQAVQAQILALIGYVPDFAQYGGAIQGGYYPDAAAYPPTQLPESKRGLRTGLAQQLLHEKMIEMQYK